VQKIIITLLFLISISKILNAQQTFGVGANPYAYLCSTNSGTGNISFYTSNNVGIGITYTISRTHNFITTTIFTGSGGSNFSFSQPAVFDVGDKIIVSVNGQTNIFQEIPVNRRDIAAAPVLSSDVTAICNGVAATFTAAGSGGTFNWPSGATATTSTQATVSTAGSYSITESNACGTSPASNVITITASSTPSAPTISASSTSLCDGASATLTASGAGGTYNWSNSTTGTTTLVSAAAGYFATETNSCGTSPASNIITITTLNTPSVAAITGTTAVCTGSTITLNDVTTGGTWSSLSTSNATVNSGGVVSGLTSGNATIKYAISNSCGTGFASTNINVISSVITAPTITSPKNLLCNGEAMTISSTAPTSGGYIIWSNGDNGNTTSITAADVYKAYELNACGQSSFSNNIIVTNLSNPSVAAISGNSSVCVGAQAALTNVTSGGAWSTLDASIATVNTSGNVLGINGTNNVLIQYAVTNACGTTTVSKTITVNALPILTAIVGLNNICTNNVFEYTNTTPGGTWSTSNPSFASVNSAGKLTTLSQTGTSTLTYTYTNANSCTSAVSKSLVVNALPIVNITSSIVSATVQLEGTGGTLYSWSSGENTAIVNKPLNITNIFTVTGTDNNGCASSKTFNIDAAPNASSTSITSTLGNTICSGASTSLSLSAGNGYYWSSGENTRSITTNTTGTKIGYVLYSVNYKVEAANIDLTFYQTPTVNPIDAINICNATGIVVTLSGAVPNTTFVWSNDNKSIGLAANGTTNTLSFTASNTTNIPVVANVAVSPTANGCIGSTMNFKIIANPVPSLTGNRVYNVCDGAYFQYVPKSNVSSPFSVVWSLNKDTSITIEPYTKSGTIIDKIKNSNDNIRTAQYIGLVSSLGCIKTDTITVNIIPNPYGTLVATKNTILSAVMDTFTFVTKDTISRTNTWNLGFGMPSFSNNKDAYSMDYNRITDTTNTVSVLVTNRFGCNNNFQKKITIIGIPLLMPNYDTIPVVRNEGDQYEPKFYPAPFKDWLKFKYYLKQSEEAEITIKEVSGAILTTYKVQLPAGNNKIDIQELYRIHTEIIYILNIKSKSIDHQQLISRID
jgi:hypothetical protein